MVLKVLCPNGLYLLLKRSKWPNVAAFADTSRESSVKFSMGIPSFLNSVSRVTFPSLITISYNNNKTVEDRVVAGGGGRWEQSKYFGYLAIVCEFIFDEG